MAEASDPQRGDGVRRRWDPALVAAVAGPALVLAVAAWLRRWTTDDAFINYRIVDHLLAGHGPVFNAGERVEAYTSALWLGLLALGQALTPLRIEHVAIAWSIPLSAGGLVAMALGSRRLLQPAATEADADDDGDSAPRIWWLPAGTLVLVALAPVWDFATAGLETGLTLGWVGITTLALAACTERPDRPPAWALVAIGLGPLVRPDATIVAGAVLALVAWRSWRASGAARTAGRLAIAGALPVTYQVFRMAYFAALVPNTALAKQASFPHWREGWAYLVDFVGPYVTVAPLALLAAAGVAAARPLDRDRRLAVAVLPAAALVQTLFIVRAGGDYAHARLLLGPLFALVAPVALLPMPGRRVGAETRRPLAWVPTAAVALVAIWAVVAAGFWRKGGPTVVGDSFVADGRQAIVGALDMAHPVTAEDQGWGKSSAPAERIHDQAITVGSRPLEVTPLPGLDTPLVAIHGVGVSGYSVGPDVFVLDQLGLGDAITSRLEVAEPGLIGHEKPLPAPWLAARLTDDEVAVDDLGAPGFAVPLYLSDPATFDDDVAAARAALDCPALRRLDAAISADLTPGRAWSNLWRSPALTRLSIPPDPTEAERDLC